MMSTNRFLALCILAGVMILPHSIFGADNAPAPPTNTYDCANNTSPWGAWKTEGNKTCRSRNVPQCKKVNGQEALAPEVKKTERQCYEGGGAPPASSRPKPFFSKPPIVPGTPPKLAQ